MKPFIRIVARFLDTMLEYAVTGIHAVLALVPVRARPYIRAIARRVFTLRGFALFLIIVPALVWGSGTTPFQPMFSLTNPARPRDVWTPVLLRAYTEAVALARELKENPQDVGNDFKLASMSTKRVVNPEVGSVAAEVPTTGVAAADDALVRATLTFLGTVAGEGEAATFTSNTRAFGKYLFVTLGATNRSEYTTIAVTKDGQVAMKDLFGVGYDGVVVESVATTLVTRFPGLSREGAVDIAKKALEKTSFRLASNGLVVSVPTRALPKADTALSYHEVLVPMSVVEQYLRK